MATYTFYPLADTGAAITVQVLELPSDKAALARARELLEQHPRAVLTEVWQGERLIRRAVRTPQMRTYRITDS